MTSIAERNATEVSVLEERFTVSNTPTRPLSYPPRLVLYGQPKVGKSTFGSLAPKPVFVCTEDGSSGLSVVRLPADRPCQTWEELLQCLRGILTQDHDRETLVIDTLDLCEGLAADYVLRAQFKGSKSDYMSFYKGPIMAGEMMNILMMALDHIRKTRNMMIILLAHDGLLAGANALGEDFKKWAPNLSKYSWNRVRDWADQIGHAQSEFTVMGGKAKGSGKDRYIYFRGSPGRDAGCRAGYEMPDKVKLNWDEYQKAMEENNNGN